MSDWAVEDCGRNPSLLIGCGTTTPQDFVQELSKDASKPRHPATYWLVCSQATLTIHKTYSPLHLLGTRVLVLVKKTKSVEAYGKVEKSKKVTVLHFACL